MRRFICFVSLLAIMVLLVSNLWLPISQSALAGQGKGGEVIAKPTPKPPPKTVLPGKGMPPTTPKRALTWHLTLAVESNTSDREAVVKQTAEIIEKRLDAFGVSNFKVSPQGNGRIVVGLPSLSDRERLKRVITEEGKLELVAIISSPSPDLQTYATQEEGIASLNSAGNRRVLPYLERSEVGAARKPKRWVVLESPAIVDGSDLSNASAIPVPGRGANNYEIQFSLDKTGAEKFGAWTGANINEYLGVVLNDEVRSIAAIMAQIFDQGVISGGFTKQSAEDLALVLRSGALPAPIRIVRERGNKE